MIPAMRRQLIMQHLSQNKIASIADLTGLLHVSHMTVRRDIQTLESAGRVVSVSGGVSLGVPITGEPPHLAKRAMRDAEKQAIALAALALTEGASTIYLDAGTTTLALARRLAVADSVASDLLLVTNDLMVASFAAENLDCRLYFCGGMVDRQNRSCVGEDVANSLKNLNIDVAFISTSSWNSRWLSTPDHDKALVKKTVMSSSTRRVLLCDSSKYGKMGAFNAVPMSNFDVVVTDAGLAQAARETLAKQGVGLVIAGSGYS